MEPETLLETLLPAENDIQVKTSVGPKDGMPKTTTRMETASSHPPQPEDFCNY